MAALRRHVLVVVAVLLIALAGVFFGAGFAILAFLVALPVVAGRYDNHTGSLLFLAILVDLTVLVMVFLVALMAIRG